MTRTIRGASLSIVLAATTASFAVTAAQASTVDRQSEVHQQQVDFADLDLRQSSGRHMLNRRVRLAARKLCFSLGESAASELGLSTQRSCATRTYRNAQPQIATAIDLATSGRRQMASAVTLSDVMLAR
jgi:UrcA family protein